MFKKISILLVSLLSMLLVSCNNQAFATDMFKYDITCTTPDTRRRVSLTDTKDHWINISRDDQYVEIDTYKRDDNTLLKETDIVGNFSCILDKTLIGTLESGDFK